MTTPAPQIEAVRLPISAVAEYWKCSNVLAKKKLQRAHMPILRGADGKAFVMTTAKNPIYLFYKKSLEKADASV